MRYNKTVYFRTVKSEFDKTTHNYEETATETKRYAAITDSGAETINLVYGGMKQGVLTIRLQRPYSKPFDNIRIGKKIYNVDFSRHQKIFVVSVV